MLEHVSIFHSGIFAHYLDGLLFAGFEIMYRLHVSFYIPTHRLRLLFDELSRGIDPALGKRNSERDQVEQHRIAQLVYDGLLRLGENRELNKPFLHRCNSVIKDADRAQAHVLGRVQTELSQAHAQGEIGDRPGTLVCAYFSSEIFGALDPWECHKIVS